MSKNIVLITNMPTPYRLPLWDELQKIFNLNVVCISQRENNRKWDVENRAYIKFLASFHFYINSRDMPLHISVPFNLFYKLIKANPDALIITGYDAIQYWEALLYATLFSKKKIMWSGSTLLSSRSKNNFVNKIKKFFINAFDSYYTYGTKASEYLESFGVSRQSIVTGINTVETTFYKDMTPNTTKNSNEISFLFVGQLVERKGLKNTIQAFSKLQEKKWTLTIVGSGPDEKELKQLTKTLNLEEKIIFVGYKQKNEVIKYYAKADVFLMPSYLEVWGLVLNEALASGLFCLSSKYAGSTFDLIENGKNGFMIDPLNINDIVENLNRTFELTLDKSFIKNSFTVSYTEEANKILQAVEKV
jgi:glycosyltransferase involved in cell wall biosynthesis